MSTSEVVGIELGEKLRSLRIARGLAQAQVGQLMGMTGQQVSKYELGRDRPSVAQLEAFAVAFRVSVHALIDDRRPTMESRLLAAFQALPTGNAKRRILGIVRKAVADELASRSPEAS